MLAKSRVFFDERKIFEVDCPLITSAASIDAHIDLIPVSLGKDTRYLHSSPEYGMKRLIAEGIGNIYQLAHVFRLGEQGARHNPEFMMAEWYLMGSSFEEMIQQTVDYIRLFIGDLPFEIISYREAFQRYAQLDYLSASTKELQDYLHENEIQTYPGILEEGKDALLNLILGTIIEPKLGANEIITVLAYYPSSQAALAKTRMHGSEEVAERFEVYFKGIELANGYHELADHAEQLQRLEESNAHRLRLGKSALPIDYQFIKALEKGFPDCCGVAVGFDRLMMLRHSVDIQQVIPFDWDIA